MKDLKYTQQKYSFKLMEQIAYFTHTHIVLNFSVNSYIHKYIAPSLPLP